MKSCKHSPVGWGSCISSRKRKGRGFLNHVAKVSLEITAEGNAAT